MEITQEEREQFFIDVREGIRRGIPVEIREAIAESRRVAPQPVFSESEQAEFTWAEAQGWIEATSREVVNRANRIMGEADVDPWERANTREHVNAVIEQVFQMVEEGRTIVLGKGYIRL